MTPAWIEPATVRFVAQHLKHCVTAVPHVVITNYRKFRKQSVRVTSVVIMHMPSFMKIHQLV